MAEESKWAQFAVKVVDIMLKELDGQDERDLLELVKAEILLRALRNGDLSSPKKMASDLLTKIMKVVDEEIPVDLECKAKTKLFHDYMRTQLCQKSIT